MLSFGKGAKKPKAKGPKDVKRLLLVTLVEARDLIACSTDATSDPYVVFSIAQGDNDLTNEPKPLSSIKRKTIHPEWNEPFSFGTQIIDMQILYPSKSSFRGRLQYAHGLG